MRFPAERLRPRGGSIHALLFENSSAGVPLGVTWAFEVDFEPIRHGEPGDESEFSPLAAWEWIDLPIRDWRALEGVVIEGEDVEGSFYLTEHEVLDWSRLSIFDRDGSEFRIEWDMVVDHEGSFDGDEDYRMRVQTSLRVPCEGVLVHFQTFPSDPSRSGELLDVLGGFLDVEAFGPPEIRTNRFGVTAFWLPPG